MARGELALPQTDPVFFILKEIHGFPGRCDLQTPADISRAQLNYQVSVIGTGGRWGRVHSTEAPEYHQRQVIITRCPAARTLWQVLGSFGWKSPVPSHLSESQRSRVSSRAVSRMFSSSASCLRRISVMRSFSSQPRSFRTCLAIRRLTSPCSPLWTAAPWPPRLRIKVSVSSGR